jgi:hypothetical protein
MGLRGEVASFANIDEMTGSGGLRRGGEGARDRGQTPQAVDLIRHRGFGVSYLACLTNWQSKQNTIEPLKQQNLNSIKTRLFDAGQQAEMRWIKRLGPDEGVDPIFHQIFAFGTDE